MECVDGALQRDIICRNTIAQPTFGTITQFDDSAAAKVDALYIIAEAGA
jgi:hypothetical protein